MNYKRFLGWALLVAMFFAPWVSIYMQGGWEHVGIAAMWCGLTLLVVGLLAYLAINLIQSDD